MTRSQLDRTLQRLLGSRSVADLQQVLPGQVCHLGVVQRPAGPGVQDPLGRAQLVSGQATGDIGGGYIIFGHRSDRQRLQLRLGLRWPIASLDPIQLTLPLKLAAWHPLGLRRIERLLPGIQLVQLPVAERPQQLDLSAMWVPL